MRTTRTLMLTAALAMAVAAPGIAREKGESPQDIKDQSKGYQTYVCGSDEDDTHDGQDPDFIEFEADEVMWPPNHKTQDIDVTAVDAGNDDTTTSVFTVSTHDEYYEDGTEWEGSGNTDNDAQDAATSADPATDADNDGRAETTVTVRAERSGRGDGRTYTVSVTAEFDEGTCTTDFTVEVPHDMGVKPNDERGQGRQVDDES